MNREVAVVAVLVLAGMAMYLLPAAAVVGPVLADDGELNQTVAEEPSGETPLSFSDVASERGLTYESVRTEPGTRGTMSRAGVYVADYDNDLDEDVLALGGDRPVLYENDGGEFEQSGALPELNESVDYRSALFVDYDNDGQKDLVLAPLFGEPLLLRNDGDEFTARPDAFNRTVDVPVAVTAADYDRDGCVDLFVTQNGDWKAAYPARVQPNRTEDNGKPNYLFEGNCGPSFERVKDAGIDGNHWTLSSSFTDFTGDGYPDIHAANDFHYDVLYVNQRNGTFEPRRIPETNRNGMASEVADIDGDGDFDVFVSNIYWTEEVSKRLEALGVITSGSIGNNLLLNDGSGQFENAAGEWGVRNGRWGWAAVVADFDNDADRDLFHTTRAQFVPEEVADRWGDDFEYFRRSRIFERTGPEQFEPRSAPDVGLNSTDGRGVGQLDFDADGSVDLVVANADGPTRLYRNEAGNGTAIQVAVRPDGNRTVLGTTVTVITSAGTEHQRLNAKADFLSQDTRTLHFGLADAGRVEVLRVEYPDGQVVTFRDRCVNQRVVVRGDRIVDRRPLNRSSVSGTSAC